MAILYTVSPDDLIPGDFFEWKDAEGENVIYEVLSDPIFNFEKDTFTVNISAYDTVDSDDESVTIPGDSHLGIWADDDA